MTFDRNTSSSSSTSVLDRARTDQMRSFLTTEAAASLHTADAHVRHFTPRRVVAGAAVATLVAGGTLAVTSAVDIPGPVSVGVTSALAVSVQNADGWTTVRLLDAEADPALVVEQLHAEGVAAELRTVPLDGRGLDEVEGLSVLTPAGDPSGGGLVGFSVSSPTLDAELGSERQTFVFAPNDGRWLGSFNGPPTTVQTPAELAAEENQVDAVRERLANAGVRVEDDGSVSMRNDIGATVIVYAGA